MQDIREDQVALYLNKHGIEQIHVNPAHGTPMPDSFDGLDGLLIYGGIQSANDGPVRPYIDDELNWLTKWLNEGRPTLGICLGAQLIAKSLGGTVSPHPDGIREVGFHKITPVSEKGDFLSAPAFFYQWHGEGFTLPKNCELLATGEQFPNQAFQYRNNTFGIQFHPEVTRPVMQDWLSSGSDSLSSKGAHRVEQQLEDEARYGEKMGTWCRNFVENWVNSW